MTEPYKRMSLAQLEHCLKLTQGKNNIIAAVREWRKRVAQTPSLRKDLINYGLLKAIHDYDKLEASKPK
jgi:hypothetical protein